MTMVRKAIWILFTYLISLISVLLILTLNTSLSRDIEDFFYLADILEKITEKEQSDTDKLKSITTWLATNVKSTENYPGWHQLAKYPDWFDPSSVASVIKGGIGNCGYQANNIIAFAQYLGINKIRRYYLGKETGSQHWHAFAEIKVDGRWGVFDPNMLGFIEDKNNNVLSLSEMVNGNTKILNTNFSNIVKEIRNKPTVLTTTKYQQVSLRFGKASFNLYQQYGAFPLKMYFHLVNASPIVNFITFLLFMIVYLSSERFILKAIDRPKNSA